MPRRPFLKCRLSASNSSRRYRLEISTASAGSDRCAAPGASVATSSERWMRRRPGCVNALGKWSALATVIVTPPSSTIFFIRARNVGDRSWSTSSFATRFDTRASLAGFRMCVAIAAQELGLAVAAGRAAVIPLLGSPCRYASVDARRLLDADARSAFDDDVWLVPVAEAIWCAPCVRVMSIPISALLLSNR